MRFPIPLLYASLALAQPRPLTLDEAVKEALDKNLNLLAERYNITIADARIITAKLKPNPVLSLNSDHWDLRHGAENTNGAAEHGVRIDYVMERGGKRQARTELAESVKSVAELQLLNTVRGVVLDVQNAFVDTLAAKASLDLAQTNLRVFNDIVQINSVRVNAGDLAKIELVRSRVAALQFQNAVRQAELRLVTAKNRLQAQLGRVSYARDFEVAGDLRRDKAVPELTGLKAESLKLRPDVQALRRDQARSQADLKLQLAQAKIDYTIGSEFRRQQGIANTGNLVGFFISMPLPVYNKNQGEIERVKREQQQLMARVRALEASISADVENAYRQYETSRGLLDSIEADLMAQAREVRDTTEYSYRRGEASFVEFLDAQRAFNDTIQGHNDARADYARALYLIDSISGKVVNP